VAISSHLEIAPGIGEDPAGMKTEMNDFVVIAKN
jgi:hypothetical protein